MLILLLVLFLLWHFGWFIPFWGLIGMTVILRTCEAIDNAKASEKAAQDYYANHHKN